MTPQADYNIISRTVPGRSKVKTRIQYRNYPIEIITRIVRHLPENDLRTAARLAACSRQFQQAVLQNQQFGRRLYRATFLLSAPGERDWLRWWLKTALNEPEITATRAESRQAVEVYWPAAFLARRQLEMAWRGEEGSKRTSTPMPVLTTTGSVTGTRGWMDAPLMRPRLREARLPVEKGERVSMLAAGPWGTVLRVAREGRILVVENRRTPRIYELSSAGLEGVPGVMTTPAPRISHRRGANRSSSTTMGPARIPGIIDACVNDRYVVLLIAESAAAAVAGSSPTTIHHPFISVSGISPPQLTLCVWKAGHERLAYRVDNFIGTRLLSLRGRWLVARRTSLPDAPAKADPGCSVFDLARQACLVGGFGGLLSRGCVQAADDRSLLVYASGVVGHRQEMLWEQWSVTPDSHRSASRNMSGQPDPQTPVFDTSRRASRSGMLHIEDVDRESLRTHPVDADRVLLLYGRNDRQRRPCLALHSTRTDRILWEHELMLPGEVHAVEVFAEAGYVLLLMRTDADYQIRCLVIRLRDGHAKHQCHWPWRDDIDRVVGSIACVRNTEGRCCLVDVATGVPIGWLWPADWEEATSTRAMTSVPVNSEERLNNRDAQGRRARGHLAEQILEMSAAVGGSHIRDDELCMTPSYAARLDRSNARLLLLDHVPVIKASRGRPTARYRKQRL